MNANDYTNPSAGQIVRGMDGNDAFVPAPLPPAIDWSVDLAAALSRADAILGELSGLGRLLPSPDLLIRPYLQREAVLSSRIEGTRASLDDVLREEPGNEGDDLGDADVLEIRNYVTAMDHGLKVLETRPVLSLNLVLDMHAILMSGIPGERGRNASPGRFRTTQNWIGAPGSSPRNAQYVPPPPEHVNRCLTDWERFANEPSPLPDLIRCALMHEQFEAIHPFNDGNGRLGRLLVTLFLVGQDRLSQPLLYLSEFIEANRLAYYASLQRVRTHGDWIGWILFFLEGVSVTGRRALSQTGQLIDLRERLRKDLEQRPKLIALIDPLLANPYMTVARASRLLKVTIPTGRSALAELEGRGIITPVETRSRRRLYVSRPILEIIDERDSD